MNDDTPARGSAVGDWTCGLSNVNVKRSELFRNRLMEIAWPAGNRRAELGRRGPISTFEACGLFKIDHFSPGTGCPGRTTAEFHALDGTQDQSRILLFGLDMKSEKPRNNNYDDHYADDVEDIHLCSPVEACVLI